jgi:glycerol-3-phosphate acyltransferase PlsY
MFITLLLTAYLSGALPWSVWLAQRFHQADPRSVGDGNPGAANAFRVGGWRLGFSVALLDFFKAFVPVLIARWGLQLPAEQLFWVALMPTLGHAFSIFLGFRGGRALVTLFGVWSGLTLYEAPLVMGAAAIIAIVLLKDHVMGTFAIPIILFAYLVFHAAAPWMLLLVLAQIVILLVKVGLHERSAPPHPNPVEP